MKNAYKYMLVRVSQKSYLLIQIKISKIKGGIVYVSPFILLIFI